VATSNERTFFVESYVSNLDEAAAATLSARLRTAVDELRQEGCALEWLRSFAFIDEETFVWMLTADDSDSVVLVNERAGVSCDHVVEAFPGG
jgi:hypothetical protein